MKKNIQERNDRFLWYLSTNGEFITSMKFKKILHRFELDILELDNLSAKIFFDSFSKNINIGDIDRSCHKIFKNKEKKFKKLLLSSQNQETLFDDFSLLSKIKFGAKLIRSNKINKDLVYNKIKEDSGSIIFDELTLKSIDLLLKNYPEKKVLNFIFSANSYYWMNEVQEGIDTLNDMGEFLKLPKKAKDLEHLHNLLVQEIEDKRKFEVPDEPLSPREDLLLLDNKTIDILGKKMFIYVAKTRHDLCKFSARNVFDNCVGSFDSYFKRGKDGISTFIGIFSETQTPLYCVETEKYSFAEAKGVSNSSIPKPVYYELQNILTLTPEVPKDFTPIKNHFIIGYKYILETQTFYLMFSKGGIYEYTQFPKETYEDFVQEKRKGQFLNKIIKASNYDYARIA